MKLVDSSVELGAQLESVKTNRIRPKPSHQRPDCGNSDFCPRTTTYLQKNRVMLSVWQFKQGEMLHPRRSGRLCNGFLGVCRRERVCGWLGLATHLLRWENGPIALLPAPFSHRGSARRFTAPALLALSVIPLAQNELPTTEPITTCLERKIPPGQKSDHAALMPACV